MRHCRFQMLAGGDGVPYRQGWVSPSVITIISSRDATMPQLGRQLTADPAAFFRQHRDQQFVDPEGSLGQLCCDAGLAFSGRCVEWNTPLVSDAARSSTLTAESRGWGATKRALTQSLQHSHILMMTAARSWRTITFSTACPAPTCARTRTRRPRSCGRRLLLLTWTPSRCRARRLFGWPPETYAPPPPLGLCGKPR